VRAEEGELAVRFTVREEMTNPMGVLHGGMVGAIIDDVIGVTVFSLHHAFFYTTVNLNIDFLSSARAGSTVTAQSRIVRQGRNIIHAECQLLSEEGKLLAKGASNLLVTQVRSLLMGNSFTGGLKILPRNTTGWNVCVHSNVTQMLRNV
jgi:uncharacterized protein (TIGR00369 family)